MKTDWTPETLIEFERGVAHTFNRGEIHAPIHLAGGNEDRLIDLFLGVRENDWVCGTWRSHYHCLLKGVPADELEREIRSGRSIALCFPRQRVICSALVGGIAPIALGLAWAAKRDGLTDRVYCFLGDMAATTGIVAETVRYARGHELPIVFVVEDNGLSVSTDTAKAWGAHMGPDGIGDVRYGYELGWPHVGSGQWVNFADGGSKTGL